MTYKGQVPDEAQARKDIQNYIRRVKAYRKKNGMDELKYIYVIEFENGEGRKKTRVHHHVIMSGMDRDAAERLWTNGWANTRRLQPDEYGLEALARYIVKDPKGKKRWSASRNLKEPKVTTADTKFTRRMAERLAKDFETDGPQIFAKLFPDCALNDCAIFRSDFVAGAYIYAKMRIDPGKKKERERTMQEKKLTMGSLFDGSGGFPLAAEMCGITPIWASEVEPYPIAVTKSRFPAMEHLGDISKINGALIKPVDVVTFGSPCQDMSVAGKRAGIKHTENGDEETTRSGLFMEAVRIIKEMREAINGEYPTYAVWENVPGAFSSNKGEDFKIVLEELIKIAEPEAPALPMPDKKKMGNSGRYHGQRMEHCLQSF